MNTSIRRIAVLLIASLGAGCGQDRSEVDASDSNEGELHTEVANETGAAEQTSKVEVPDEVDDASPFDIDFPLLDGVRWLDLIDTEVRFPDELKRLDGRRVQLVGFMAPFDSLEDMRRCMIVPAYVGCQFCSPPKLAQVLYVTQGTDDAPGGPYPFIEEPSLVVGTLRLSLPESEHEGKKQGFLYCLEDAVAAPYTGEAPERAPGHGTTSPVSTAHQQGATLLDPVETAQLVEQVAEVLGRPPLRPIEVEPVSTEAFNRLVRSRLEALYPDATRALRARAFSLLGMMPEGIEWIPTLEGIELSLQRAALADETGDRIHLLDDAPSEHAYVRLELVGAIADAIVRQHSAGLRTGSGDAEPSTRAVEDEDARRAHEALRKGIRTIAAYRYSLSRGIPQATLPPIEFDEEEWDGPFASLEMDLWASLPTDVGSFFVDYFVGANQPFSGVDPALARPPSTTMEFFRPRWYEDSALWRHEPVPRDFADDLLETPPGLTDVLGIGGLVPWLVGWYSVDVAKSLAGGWAGDRWAIWQFPDGSSALLLETRWQDEESAARFREGIFDEPFQSVLPYEAGSLTVRLLRADSDDALLRLAKAFQGEERPGAGDRGK